DTYWKISPLRHLSPTWAQKVHSPYKRGPRYLILSSSLFITILHFLSLDLSTDLGIGGPTSGPPPALGSAGTEAGSRDSVDYGCCFATSDLFDSCDEAVKWAKNIAIIWGFQFVISRNLSNEEKELRCHRGERYRGTAGKVGNFVKAVMRKSKTKSTGCPFMINVKRDATSKKFCISVPLDNEKGTNNHAFAVNPEGQRQMSGLSDPSREIVRDMSSAQAPPAVILAAIQEKHPVDNATIRQVYNYKANLRKESLEGRDVVGQLLHLATVSKYIVYTDVNPSTQALTHVFMSHPQAGSLFRTYYWYVGIDSTYKTNRYVLYFINRQLI
ncbi:Unknown protein, partial [Striga hermonthica]